MSAIPPGSIVSSPVSLVPQPYVYEEEPRTLSNKPQGISMLKNPHVNTSTGTSALSNPIYGTEESNIYQTISSGRENEYEDPDDNFNSVPYEVPVESSAGIKGKVLLCKKSVAKPENTMVIKHQNAVYSEVENEQAAENNRTSHSQDISKVKLI